MTNKEDHRSSHARASFQRRGTMLLLALFFIVVATSLAALIMANSSQLIRTTRHEHEAMVLRQLIDSGRDWVLTSDGPQLEALVTLSGAGIVPEGSSGEVYVRRDDDAPGMMIITAEVAFPRHKLTRTTRFRLSP